MARLMISDDEWNEWVKIQNTEIEYKYNEEFDKLNPHLRLFTKSIDDFEEAELLWHRILMDDPVNHPHTHNVNTKMLLSKEEERILFLQYNYAKYVVYKIQQKAREKSIRTREIRRALKWWQIAKQRRETLTVANLGLVRAMRRKFNTSSSHISSTNITPEELHGEGENALIRCLETFDVSRGFKFSTYSCRAIKQRMNRYIERTNKRRGRETDTFDFTDSHNDPSFSYDAPIEYTESINDLLSILDENKAGLDVKEIIVLKERFGINEEQKPRFLWEVGKKLNRVSKERVRQLEVSALFKLRYYYELIPFESTKEKTIDQDWKPQRN